MTFAQMTRAQIARTANRRQGGQPTPKYPKYRKNTGFWPLHSRIWGVDHPGFQKCGVQDPLTPRRRRPCFLVLSSFTASFTAAMLYLYGRVIEVCVCVWRCEDKTHCTGPQARTQQKFRGGHSCRGRHYRPKRAACHFCRAAFYLLEADVFLRRAAFYLLRAVHMRPSKSDVLPSDRGITPIVGCIMC